jgi:hypothetical protein
MAPFSAVCVFCEDVREEKSGQYTIVGTMPDNLIVKKARPAPNARPFLPKMGIYLRIHLDAEQNVPTEVSAKIINTDGQVVVQTIWDHPMVDKAFVDSRANRMPLVGLIFKVVLSPFPITDEGGKIIAVVIVDGIERVAGDLNVTVSTA